MITQRKVLEHTQKCPNSSTHQRQIKGKRKKQKPEEVLHVSLTNTIIDPSIYTN